MDTNIAPPLDIDLNSVDTSMPLIENGAFVGLRCDKVEKTKSGKGLAMLKLTWKTTTPAKSIKGENLNAGITVFDQIMLEPSGKATWEMVMRGVAGLTQAAGVGGTFGDFVNGGFATLQGCTPNAKIAYVPEGPDRSGILRRAKNEIAVYLKP